MSEKNKFDIKILGHVYTIKSDKSEEYVQSIADRVNEKVSELRGENPGLKEIMLLNLALLYFSEENIEVSTKYKDLLKKSEVPLREYNTLLNKNDSLVKEIEKLEENTSSLKDDILNSNKEIEKLNLNIKNINNNLNSKNEQLKEKDNTLVDIRKDYTESLKLINSLQKELEEIKGKVL